MDSLSSLLSVVRTMGSTLMLAVICVSLAAQSSRSQLPISRRAELRVADSIGNAAIRIAIPATQEDKERPFRFAGRDLGFYELAAELRAERRHRGDRGLRSALEVVVEADGDARARRLVSLQRLCNLSSLQISRVYLAVAPQTGAAKESERLLPFFVRGRYRPDDSVEEDSRLVEDEPLRLAALEAIERLRAPRIENGRAVLTPLEFDRMLARMKAEDPRAGLLVRVSHPMLVRDLMPVIDLLHARGFRSDAGRVDFALGYERHSDSFSTDDMKAWKKLDEEHPARIILGSLEALDLFVRDEPDPAINDGYSSLQWLVAHQSTDGFWDADGFMREDTPLLGRPCDGAGAPDQDLACTLFALYLFLAPGQVESRRGFAEPFARGLSWLLAQQDDAGRFVSSGHGDGLRQQALATLFLAQLYLAKASNSIPSQPTPTLDDLRGPLEKAVRDLQHRLHGENREPSLDCFDDPSLLWTMLALATARHAGFAIGDGILERAVVVLARSRRHLILARLLRGDRAEDDPELRKEVRLLAVTIAFQNLLGLIGDLEDRTFASICFRLASERTFFDIAMESYDVLGSRRRSVGNAAGSFDPTSSRWWGGRVAATALSILGYMIELRYSGAPGSVR